MSRSWNGESLVDELSSFLGDTSTSFKTRVLGWCNDVIFDISQKHDWGFHLTKGKKLLTYNAEVHSLEIEAPAAPEVEIIAGGSLSAYSKYKVLVTFCQDNGVESIAGEESEEVTATATDLTINLTNIPISPESLVTSRCIYLSKDDGSFFYSSTINDNFTQTATILSNTSSTTEPPDYDAIRRLNGSPFFEQSPSIYLKFKEIDQLRAMIEGEWSSGSPEYFSPVENNSISTYPLPASDFEVSFNYYRNPFKLYYTKDSQPDLPIYLKTTLKAGVIAYGYEYRDRQGQETKKANYENSLFDAINRGARVANIEYSVKDVNGNYNGFGVN